MPSAKAGMGWFSLIAFRLSFIDPSRTYPGCAGWGTLWWTEG